MNKQDYINKMKELREKHTIDIEHYHIKADTLLCEILCELGYEKVVEEYIQINKWYS